MLYFSSSFKSVSYNLFILSFTDMQFSNNKSILATATNDSGIIFWDIGDPKISNRDISTQSKIDLKKNR